MDDTVLSESLRLNALIGYQFAELETEVMRLRAEVERLRKALALTEVSDE